jgi:hypothetical protein
MIANLTPTLYSPEMCISNTVSYRRLPTRALRAIQASFRREVTSKRGTFAYLNQCASAFLAPSALPRATTATRTMFSHTFPLPQKQNDLRFISYKAPPRLKQTSRRISSKVPSNEDRYPGIDEVVVNRPGSGTGRKDKEGLVTTSLGVEVIDLTSSGRHP